MAESSPLHVRKAKALSVSRARQERLRRVRGNIARSKGVDAIAREAKGKDDEKYEKIVGIAGAHGGKRQEGRETLEPGRLLGGKGDQI